VKTAAWPVQMGKHICVSLYDERPFSDQLKEWTKSSQ